MLAVLHLPLSPAVESSLFELNRLTMQHGSKVIGSLERLVRIDGNVGKWRRDFLVVNAAVIYPPHNHTPHRTDGG
jgi:hypothetical protein